jgi:hypothetical protein
MHTTIYNKDKAKRLPHSTFDVERSMFDVQIVASEITTKPSYHVEITYTGQEKGKKNLENPVYPV